MRRSAWTIGATVLAALSLGVAACGGSDNSSSDDSKHQHRHQGAREGQDRRQADGALDWRRRSHRLRPDLLPDGQFHLQRHAEAALQLQAGRRQDPGRRTSPTAILRFLRTARPSRSRSRRASSTRRPTTRKSRPRTSSTRSSAASSARWPPASRSRTTRTSRARRSTSSRARRSRASQTPDPTDARAQVQAPARRRDGLRRPGLRRDRAGAEGVRREVRRQDAVDLRREPARDRPVHDRERRVGQGDRLRAGQAHPPGPQPELGQVAGLQARVPRRDRQPRGQ